MLAARAGEPGVAQRPQVVPDEILGALGHPREVTHAQLASLAERNGDGQPRRVAQRGGARSGLLCRERVETRRPQGLCAREIEAEEIAAIVGHGVILTAVGVTGPAFVEIRMRAMLGDPPDRRSFSVR